MHSWVSKHVFTQSPSHSNIQPWGADTVSELYKYENASTRKLGCTYFIFFKTHYGMFNITDLPNQHNFIYNLQTYVFPVLFSFPAHTYLGRKSLIGWQLEASSCQPIRGFLPKGNPFKLIHQWAMCGFLGSWLGGPDGDFFLIPLN